MADLTAEQVAVTLAVELARVRLELEQVMEVAALAAVQAATEDLMGDPQVRAMLDGAPGRLKEPARETTPAELEALMYRMAVDMAADLRRGSASSA